MLIVNIKSIIIYIKQEIIKAQIPDFKYLSSYCTFLITNFYTMHDALNRFQSTIPMKN